nr:sensor histidine kinase N-terminal domain-containing protein [Vogesella oryzae]
MKCSLRRELVQWVVLPLLPLAAATAWLAQDNARDAANAAFDRTLQASARSIAERITLQDGELVVDLPVAALEMFDPHFQDRVFYRIGFAGGSTITGDAELPLPAQLPAAGELRFYDAHFSGEAIRSVVLAQPLHYGGGQRLLLVQVSETTLSRQALARQLFRELLLQQWLIGAVAALLVAVGINRALRPLQRVRAILRAGQRQPGAGRLHIAVQQKAGLRLVDADQPLALLADGVVGHALAQQHAHGIGQQLQLVLLVGAELPWLAIVETQGANDMVVIQQQRRAGVEAHAEAGDQRIVGKAGILPGILHHQHVAVGHHVAAQR